MKIVRSSNITLAILDVMIPKINGVELCQNIRKTMSFPILFLTEKGHEDSKIKSLICKCDDYIRKPFSSKELTARVATLLKRNEDNNATRKCPLTLHKLHNLILDELSSTVKVNGNKVNLTDIEYKILLILLKNKGNVLCADIIFKKIWEECFTQISNNTVVMQVKNIRKKLLMLDNKTEYIHTVWGKGYCVY